MYMLCIYTVYLLYTLICIHFAHTTFLLLFILLPTSAEKGGMALRPWIPTPRAPCVDRASAAACSSLRMRDLTIAASPVLYNILTDNNVDVSGINGDDGRRCGLAGEWHQIILGYGYWKCNGSYRSNCSKVTSPQPNMNPKHPRGLPYMTSTRFWDFFDPLPPLFCKMYTVCASLEYFLTPSPSFCSDVIYGSPPTRKPPPPPFGQLQPMYSPSFGPSLLW